VDVLADEGPAPAQGLRGPVDVQDVVGQLAATLAGIDEQGADAPVDVDPGVAGGGPAAGRQLVQPVAALAQEGRQPLEGGRPLVEVSSRSPGPPTVRACSTIPARSTPALDTRATGPPVEASTTVAPSSPAVYQSSRT
jgi:hypothetical protein